MICLIGFMGSGKTTIGQELSKVLNTNWIDLDTYIEEMASKSIPEIFKEEGEAYFRQLEQEALQKLVTKEGILSTGGGVITTLQNIKVLQKNCTIYLKYSFDTLYKRIAGDENRPLVTSYEDLKTRFLSRLDLYEKAGQVKIDCEGKSINEIIQEIITYLEKVS